MVRGAIPVPTIEPDPATVAEEAIQERRDQVTRQHNLRSFDQDVRHAVLEAEDVLLQTAIVRNHLELYTSKSRARRIKTSEWEQGEKKDYSKFSIEFKTKRKKVDRVEKFDMFGPGSTEVSFWNGKIYRVEYRYTLPNEERIDAGELSPLDCWIWNTINLRGANTISQSAKGKPASDTRGEIVFALGSRKIHLTSRGSGGGMLDSLDYNPSNNRFTHIGDAEGLTEEEIDALVQLESGGDAERKKELKNKYTSEKRHKRPIITADEFIEGLELVLAGIPGDE